MIQHCVVECKWPAQERVGRARQPNHEELTWSNRFRQLRHMEADSIGIACQAIVLSDWRPGLEDRAHPLFFSRRLTFSATSCKSTRSAPDKRRVLPDFKFP